MDQNENAGDQGDWVQGVSKLSTLYPSDWPVTSSCPPGREERTDDACREEYSTRFEANLVALLNGATDRSAKSRFVRTSDILDDLVDPPAEHLSYTALQHWTTKRARFR